MQNMITSITAGRKAGKEIKMQTEKSVEIVRLLDIASREVERQSPFCVIYQTVEDGLAVLNNHSR